MISKKLFSVLLALCMVLSIMPAGLVAFADDDPEALHVGKNTVVSGTTYTFTPEEDGNYWFSSVSEYDVYVIIKDPLTEEETSFDDIYTDDGDILSFNFRGKLTLEKDVTYRIYTGIYGDADTFKLYISPEDVYEISLNYNSDEFYVVAPPFAEAGQNVSFLPEKNNPLIVFDNIAITYTDAEDHSYDVDYSENDGSYSFVMPESAVSIDIGASKIPEDSIIPLSLGENAIEDGTSGRVIYSFAPEKDTFYSFTSATGVNPQLSFFDSYYDTEDGFAGEVDGHDFKATERLLPHFTYYLTVDFGDNEVTGGTITVEELPPIIISGHALVLSGEIGLTFYFEYLPAFPAEDCYVEFKTGNFNTKSTAEFLSGYVIGTCYIPAYRMADKITPVVHYSEDGVDKTVEFEPYSVEDYIRYVTEYEVNYSQITVLLAKGLANYGCYAQNYLKELHGYSVGEGGKYAEMSTYFDDIGSIGNDGYNYDDYRDNLNDWVDYDKDVDDSRVEKATVSLNLEATTSLYLYLTVKDGVVLSRADAYYTDDNSGVEAEIELYSDNVYRVAIKDIKANDLGRYVTIDVYDENDDGTASYTIAPLTYASLAMANENIAPDFADALCALYDYALIAKIVEDSSTPIPLDPDEPIMG